MSHIVCVQFYSESQHHVGNLGKESGMRRNEIMGYISAFFHHCHRLIFMGRTNYNMMS